MAGEFRGHGAGVLRSAHPPAGRGGHQDAPRERAIRGRRRGVRYAEEARSAAGHVEAGGTIAEALVPRRGRATGLVADATGNAWLGTDAGELSSLLDGRVAAYANAPASGTVLALRAEGGSWYLGSSGAGSVLGAVGGSAVDPPLQLDYGAWHSIAPAGAGPRTPCPPRSL